MNTLINEQGCYREKLTTFIQACSCNWWQAIKAAWRENVFHDTDEKLTDRVKVVFTSNEFGKVVNFTPGTNIMKRSPEEV